MKEIDILERLKTSTKINGAYPRDIADAIKEIEFVRNLLLKYYHYVSDTNSDKNYDEDYHLAHMDAEAYVYLWDCIMIRKEDASAR